MAIKPYQVDLIPPDKLEEGHLWREWLSKVGIYLQKQQVVLTVPQYTTALLPPTPKVGEIVFDITAAKFKGCEVAGTWRTFTTT